MAKAPRASRAVQASTSASRSSTATREVGSARESELQRASAAYVQLQQQVGLDVREASALFDQARQSRLAWGDRIVTPLARQSHRCRGIVRRGRELVPLRPREQPAADRGARARAGDRRRRAARAGAYRARRRDRMPGRERRSAVNRERYRVACLVATVVLASCSRDAAPQASATPAAKVTAAVPEAALTTLTLTSEAQKRLGIETARAEHRTIARSRSVGGEIVPAGGAQITVTAPVAGTLGADSRMPAVGSHVEKGQVVLDAGAAGARRTRRAHRGRASRGGGGGASGDGGEARRARAATGAGRLGQSEGRRRSTGRSRRCGRGAEGGPGSTRAGCSTCERIGRDPARRAAYRLAPHLACDAGASRQCRRTVVRPRCPGDGLAACPTLRGRHRHHRSTSAGRSRAIGRAIRACGAWLPHRSPPRRRQMRRPPASTSFTASPIAIGHCIPDNA